MTRGWTFQETMLSTRRISFTKEQVYYECKSMQCSESPPPNLEQWHAEDMQAFRGGMNRQIFELSPLNLALFDVWVFIAGYSSRKLSYDDDSLSGFLGIVAFLETPRLRYRIFGECPLQRNVIISPAEVIGTPRTPYRACMVPSTKSRRRPGLPLPSWSLTGWEGAHWSNGLAHCYFGCDCDEKSPATVLGAETEAEVLIDWESPQPMLTARSELKTVPRVVLIEVWTVSLRINHFPLMRQHFQAAGVLHLC